MKKQLGIKKWSILLGSIIFVVGIMSVRNSGLLTSSSLAETCDRDAHALAAEQYRETLRLRTGIEADRLLLHQELQRMDTDFQTLIKDINDDTLALGKKLTQENGNITYVQSWCSNPEKLSRHEQFFCNRRKRIAEEIAREKGILEIKIQENAEKRKALDTLINDKKRAYDSLGAEKTRHDTWIAEYDACALWISQNPETVANCIENPSLCYRCGNSIREGDEECDDGNGLDDNCDNNCRKKNMPLFSCADTDNGVETNILGVVYGKNKDGTEFWHSDICQEDEATGRLFVDEVYCVLTGSQTWSSQRVFCEFGDCRDGKCPQQDDDSQPPIVMALIDNTGSLSNNAVNKFMRLDLTSWSKGNVLINTIPLQMNIYRKNIEISSLKLLDSDNKNVDATITAIHQTVDNFNTKTLSFQIKFNTPYALSPGSQQSFVLTGLVSGVKDNYDIIYTGLGPKDQFIWSDIVNKTTSTGEQFSIYPSNNIPLSAN